jgi:hypothetical protein
MKGSGIMANGSFGGGTGVLDDPYLIEDIFDLIEVKNNLAGHFKLVRDIDLNVYPYNTGEGWIPLGGTFTGEFDGDFHTIYNLYIERNSTHQGLFHYMNGTFKNCYLEDFRINVDDLYPNRYGYMGAIAGYCSNASARVENVVVSRLKIYGDGYIGGLFGYSYASIKNCLVDDFELNMNADYCGGIVGYKYDGDLESCFVDNIRLGIGSSTTSSYLGGIVDYNRTGMVHNCFFNNTNFPYYGGGGTGLSETEMKLKSNYVGLGATSKFDDTLNHKNFKSWIIDVTELDRPRLFMEKGVNRTTLTYMSDYTDLVHFGGVVEGEVSTYRKVNVKVAYDVPIRTIDITWDRKTGISTLTSIEFSLDQTFATPTSELHFTGLELLRGDEITFYMRVNTSVGMTGDGQFNLYVDVSS